MSLGQSGAAPDRFYITTAIDYANGDPHLGHAFEKIGADAIARYRRLCGDDVEFLMGMDEHGQKVAQTAAERGLEPQALVDIVADEFQNIWTRLGISHDHFVRTTDERHKRGVRALIERIFERNPDDFYERSYEGWYCVGCELFKREAEIDDGRCVLHPTRELQWTEERNWFFRLTRYDSFLRELFASRPDFLLPESRRNEILGLLESGLEDISVTRSRLDWAIPFPRPTSTGETQGTWVWFDALPNYLTATGYPDEGYETLWPARLHVIGKDITRLHCVIWPAMLQSAGISLPHAVWAHGFVTFDGERFSKSAGVKLELMEAIDRHGPDAFRYFLLREVPWDGDGGFSYDRFDDRYTAELANDLGNLASRSLAMVTRYRDGRVPHASRTDLDQFSDEAVDRYADQMNRLLLHEGAAAAFSMISEANSYIVQRAPWKIAKEEARSDELDAVLASLVRVLGIAAVLLSPFMPEKMQSLWQRLGSPGAMPRLDRLKELDPGGWQASQGEPLFPRAELATAGSTASG
ncbi:methionine--tRNA ligase [soil metagenome]